VDELIFIVVKFKTRPEWSERWLDHTRSFTDATRAEPGNLWFEWSRSVDDPQTYVLVEAFEGDEAAVAHVNSEHFKASMQDLPQALVETPRIVNTSIADASDWAHLAEMSVDPAS
jgi:quinol monooxygenase YgiN